MREMQGGSPASEIYWLVGLWCTNQPTNFPYACRGVKYRHCLHGCGVVPNVGEVICARYLHLLVVSQPRPTGVNCIEPNCTPIRCPTKSSHWPHSAANNIFVEAGPIPPEQCQHLRRIWWRITRPPRHNQSSPTISPSAPQPARRALGILTIAPALPTSNYCPRHPPVAARSRRSSP